LKKNFSDLNMYVEFNYINKLKIPEILKIQPFHTASYILGAG